GEIGLVEDFAVPLLYRGDTGRQHERRALHESHGSDAHDGLAGPAGQDNDAAAATDVAAGVEDVGRLPLIVADREGQAGAALHAQAERQGRAFRVAGEILGRVTDPDQGLLENAAMGRVEMKALRIDAVAEELADSRLADQLFQERAI